MAQVTEYRVRNVHRWIVTRYLQREHGGSIETIGEFDNEVFAHTVCEAMKSARVDEKVVSDGLTDHNSESEIKEVASLLAGR